MEAASLVLGVSAAGAALGAFVLRTRAPAVLVGAILAFSGAGVGVGGMLLQDAPSGLEVGLIVGGLALLFPFHVHVVFGGMGRRGPSGAPHR